MIRIWYELWWNISNLIIAPPPTVSLVKVPVLTNCSCIPWGLLVHTVYIVLFIFFDITCVSFSAPLYKTISIHSRLHQHAIHDSLISPSISRCDPTGPCAVGRRGKCVSIYIETVLFCLQVVLYSIRLTWLWSHLYLAW